MLRINQLTSAEGAKQYYTQALSREDYYIQGQEIVGQWHGRGATLLRLSGDVDRDRFFALADNLRPDTGATLTVRQKDGRRVGYDFTFSAPKSVSILYAMTGDKRLLDAFRSAVGDTMREMEAAVKTRVSEGKEKLTPRTTGNMIWSDFIHTVTRPVDGMPDPDLHAHCVAFNATYDLKEQRWKAADFHNLKQDAPYYEAAFHSRLAARMRSLGFGIERHGKWWDIAGIPRDLIEKFSRRTAMIEAKADELGITKANAKGELGARTREQKALYLDQSTLKAAWQGRLSATDRTALDAVLSTGSSADSGGQTGITPEEALAYAVTASFERVSVVSEKQLYETALRRGVGAVSPEEIAAAAERAGILTATVNGRKLVTTREVLAEEEAMLAFARNGRGTLRSLGGLAAEYYHSDTLNPGQVAAVKHVLTSSNRVMLIRGRAGTGKTTLMKEAVTQIEKRSGKRVFTFAPSADASRGVLRQEGFTDADTVARLLVDEVLQERLRGNVLWIDEAGLLGVRDMAKVFALADRLDCRVILSGDSKQHGSVSRGDALRLLEARAGIRPAETTDIMRQRGTYRDAVAAIAKGDLTDGLERLDTFGCFVEVLKDDPYLMLCNDYLKTLNAGKTALIISPTHREGEAVTKEVREALKRTGKIGMEDRPFWALRNLYWTEAEKGDAGKYRSGLVVQFFQNAKGVKNGERLRIEGTDENGNVQAIGADGRTIVLPLQQATRFQVYEPYRLGLAAGDTIRITQNGKTQEGKKLNNGALYQVKRFTRDGNIVLNNGWVIGKEFSHVAHGYCATSHASQGKTVDRVFIAQSAESFPASSQEQFYVSVSRGREEVRIYTDDKEALKERVKESGLRASATELVEGTVTARIKPLDAWEQHRARRERYRRYMAQRERVLAAMQPEMAQEQEVEPEPERERNVRPGMER